MVKMKYNDLNDVDLEGYVIYWFLGNIVYFNIIVLSFGEYGLEIYVNDLVIEDLILYYVVQYLVKCNEDVKIILLLNLNLKIMV